MIYSSLLLNGDWKMAYSEDTYIDCSVPSFDGTLVKNAVPGLWEDMTDILSDMVFQNIKGNFFYERSFVWEKCNSDAVLHFSGVQNAVSVWINGEFLGRHEDCSTPFDISIPENIIKYGENIIVLSVSNSPLKESDNERGAEPTPRASCECKGGIAGDVELRVYNTPIRDISLSIRDDLEVVFVDIKATSQIRLSWYVSNEKRDIIAGKSDGNFIFYTSGLELWSPENPTLYMLRLDINGKIFSTPFGVKHSIADDTHFQLNDTPYSLR